MRSQQQQQQKNERNYIERNGVYTDKKEPTPMSYIGGTVCTNSYNIFFLTILWMWCFYVFDIINNSLCQG